MTEQQQNQHAEETIATAEAPSVPAIVLDFPPPGSRRQAPPAARPRLTDAEVEELQQLLPILRALAKEWPEFRERMNSVTGRCLIAQNILRGE